MEITELVLGVFGEEWTSIVLLIGLLITISVFIKKVTRNADNELDPAKREELSTVLLDFRAKGVDTGWVPNFIYVSNSFFGVQHFTVKCFVKSSLISIICFIFLFFFWSLGALEKSNIVGVIPLVLLLNIPVDYFSLFETRWVMQTRLSLVRKIVIDFVLTMLLMIAWLALILLVLWIVTVILGSDGFTILSLVGNSFRELGVSEIIYVISIETVATIFVFIPFLTTFSTSVWLWLHGLSEGLIRMLNFLPNVMKWLHVKDAPLRAIGNAMILIVWGLGAMLIPVVMIFD